MLPKEHPHDRRPGNDGAKEPWDGAIAAAFAGQARQPHHGDPTGHRQQGPDDPAQLTDRRRIEIRTETA